MKYASINEKGGRLINEDLTAVITDNDLLMAVVADGLGGCGGGKTASEAAVKSLCDDFQLLAAFETEKTKLAFERANQSVISCQTRAVKMKSTAAVLAADTEKRRYMWAHIGDSRLYHFRNGKVLFYTADHSVSRIKAEVGEITLQQIRSDRDRNKLLRALGILSEKNTASISRVYEAGEDEKNAFLLCTDGFWEYVLENEMEECLEKASTPQEWLELMLAVHDSKAPEDCDNYSAAALME